MSFGIYVWRNYFAGYLRGKDVDVVNVFEAVGMHASGEFSDQDLKEQCVACPSAGACGGQFTANTMAREEAIGLAIPNSAGAPAP